MLVACRRPKRICIHGSGNISIWAYVLYPVYCTYAHLSFSFASLIGMHVCPTWDEQFGRQRIRFRRTFSTSEYPVPGTPTSLPPYYYSSVYQTIAATIGTRRNRGIVLRESVLKSNALSLGSAGKIPSFFEIFFSED